MTVGGREREKEGESRGREEGREGGRDVRREETWKRKEKYEVKVWERKVGMMSSLDMHARMTNNCNDFHFHRVHATHALT